MTHPIQEFTRAKRVEWVTGLIEDGYLIKNEDRRSQVGKNIWTGKGFVVYARGRIPQRFDNARDAAEAFVPKVE